MLPWTQRALLVWVGLVDAACFFQPEDASSAPSEATTNTQGSTVGTEPGTQSSTTTPTTGAGESTTADVTASTANETASTADMTATTAITTGPAACQNDQECEVLDPGKPFCVAEECVACTQAANPDAACASLDPATPACDPVGGTCVECTADIANLCAGDVPVCDERIHECVGCSEHADCGISACDQQTGGCLPPRNVIWVDAVADCESGDGTMTAPFCGLSDAFLHLSLQDVSLGWTIRVKASNYIQPSLIVPDGADLAIIGDGGAAKIRSTAGPTLEVGAGSRVHLAALALDSNADSIGLACMGGTILADDVVFRLNAEGYVGADCEATLRRAVFYKNTGGGLRISGPGSTWLVNSFVSNNGSNAASNYGGISSSQGHELHLLYTSVINNLSETGARSIQCADAGVTDVRNAVIIAFVPPSVACPGANIEHSAIDEGKVDGDTNHAATMGDVMSWFEPQVGGVYRAIPRTPLASVASWAAGDPGRDFDGDLRPGQDGSPDYAGADVPPP